MSYKMSKREGGLLLWDIIRGKSGSRVNLHTGGSYSGFIFPGGGVSDPEDILLYNTGIEYILLPYSSSSSFFGSLFFQSAITSSISTQFEIF